MKDAYSFHATEECLNAYYVRMRDAYHRIFANLGLKTVTVAADNGAMGGNFSAEIMGLSPCGTDTIAVCNKCKTAENLEVVTCHYPQTLKVSKTKGIPKKIHTPNVKTIDQLAKFLNTTAQNLVKSMIYQTEKGYVFCVLRGDHDVNDIKLRKHLGVQTLEPADKAKAEKDLGTSMGSAGPIGIKNVWKIIADRQVDYMSNFVVGANIADYHLTDVNNGDFNAEYIDIRLAVPGDTCSCGDNLQFTRAYELGHIFALGQHYTKKLNLTYVSAQNKDELLTMGCYGIGIERTIAAIIEQNHDANGIVWPRSVAPILVNIIDIALDGRGEQIYQTLLANNIDVLWDDRIASPGIKFKDSDLLGIPYKIVIGKTQDGDKLEFTSRMGEKKLLTLKEIINELSTKRI
jgi:prolyl-tRNA synthetase